MSRRLPPCSVPGGEWRYDGEWWNLYVSGRWSGYTYRLRREGFWTGNAADLTGGCFAKTYFDAKARREGMAHVEASWRKLHCSPELATGRCLSRDEHRAHEVGRELLAHPWEPVRLDGDTLIYDGKGTVFAFKPTEPFRPFLSEKLVDTMFVPERLFKVEQQVDRDTYRALRELDCCKDLGPWPSST